MGYAVRVLILLLPLAAALSAPAAQAQQARTTLYGGPGGAPFRLECGQDAAIVGFNARVGAWMDWLQPVCQRFSGNAANGPSFVPNGVGGQGGHYERKLCPAGTMVVGLTAGSDNFVSDITMFCARWLPAQRAFEVAAVYTITGAYPGRNRPVIEGNVSQCQRGMKAVALIGRAGVYIDAVALACDWNYVRDQQRMVNPPPPILPRDQPINPR